MKYLSDALMILGFGAITVGCGLWSIPLGCIVGGIFMAAAGALIAWLRAKPARAR